LGAEPITDSAATQTVASAHLAYEPTAIAKDVTTRDFSPASVKPAMNPVAALPFAIPVASTNETGTATAHVETTAPEVQQSKAPPAASASQSITAPINRPLATTGKREPNDGTASIHHPAASPPKLYDVAVDQPRMQISGRPRKLVYPVCPETQARGKVSLQAVVSYDGAVSRVRVLTGDRTLAAAAVEAVRQWRYEPFSGAAPRLERETNITISFISNEVVAVSFPGSASLSR
jgi:protein TonB